MTSIDDELMRILACPKCKSKVVNTDDGLECTNPECRLVYPVRDNIPIMLIDEATKRQTEASP